MTTVVWLQLPLRLAHVVIMLLAAWCMVRDGPRSVALGSCCVVRHTCAGKGKRPCWFGESLADRSGPRHSWTEPPVVSLPFGWVSHFALPCTGGWVRRE